jgi:hypothetical protein
MEVIQTFTKGTTIEFGQDSHGNQVHRICTPSGSMCRYAESNHVAQAYAVQFEDWYGVGPEKI